MMDPAFIRYVGIDYSGAETPTARLKGLAVYMAIEASAAGQVPPARHKYWNQRRCSEWLAERLSEDTPTLVGIDHGFSFPLRYFVRHRLPRDWSQFLDDFQRHWPTDADHTYVDFVREGVDGNGAARTGNSRWRRLTEERSAQIGVPFRCPGVGRKIDARRIALVALPTPTARRARSLLAVRWVGHSARTFGDRRSLSVPLETPFSAQRPQRPSTRRFLRLLLAAEC